jgi:hypothetical protein
VLLPLLDRSTPFPPHITSKDPLAVHPESGHRSRGMDRYAHLGLREGATEHARRLLSGESQASRLRIELGMALGVELGIGAVRHSGGEHTGFHSLCEEREVAVCSVGNHSCGFHVGRFCRSGGDFSWSNPLW